MRCSCSSSTRLHFLVSILGSCFGHQYSFVPGSHLSPTRTRNQIRLPRTKNFRAQQYNPTMHRRGGGRRRTVCGFEGVKFSGRTADTMRVLILVLAGDTGRGGAWARGAVQNHDTCKNSQAHGSRRTSCFCLRQPTPSPHSPCAASRLFQALGGPRRLGVWIYLITSGVSLLRPEHDFFDLNPRTRTAKRKYAIT